MLIDILGTPYNVQKIPYGQDEYMTDNLLSGCCDRYQRTIKIVDISTDPGFKNDSPQAQRQAETTVLRHEIIHAFLFECGLAESSNSVDAWAENEEMVDWIARQFPKILKACTDADAL